uniref:Uncharacterized protein n=1 Tax=Physcomitrium patens TaxID=3218 RepID=A0A2K1K6T0_PHYPA|nr:hypothetical protein PHYPA_011378 [Physcomitrium patens]
MVTPRASGITESIQYHFNMVSELSLVGLYLSEHLSASGQTQKSQSQPCSSPPQSFHHPSRHCKIHYMKGLWHYVKEEPPPAERQSSEEKSNRQNTLGSMKEFLRSIKDLVDKLTQAEVDWTDCVVTLVLNAQPQQYSRYVRSLMTQKRPLILRELEPFLLGKESRLCMAQFN